ncbi:alpha-amylase AmyA [Cryptococcus wingfieldii CBS 7118]|uniref:alpha-amylase n=1 Tax=Cryptococcus wingfieldii CBS 7118 TaxID=1295528 RepID=A0A1E3I543_9TREE|nr:alpha-amylase AmyA [Cryptococcus wingfieldii CBS 7118]ODN83783.1 alpha-amylase AmyA [Cryptococcus wingfieldii CBS 7118]
MAARSKLLALLPFLALSQAATSEEWRSRSIYQIVTDRFASPSDSASCPLGSTTYCGGTWQGIISKLDYVQSLGFDAVWISPTALNVEGSTEYGEAYHGYWTSDPTQLNSHFGNETDLKALSSALHSRGMYLMADIALNALSSASSTLSADSLSAANDGTLLFKDPSNYHDRCDIDYSDEDSIRQCWLTTGDDNGAVAMMDLKTEDDTVAGVLKDWIKEYAENYDIDGLRVDASRHMGTDFQHDLCAAAGIFCIGEIFEDNTSYVAGFQGDGALDATLGFPMKTGLIDTFTGSDTTSTLAGYISDAAQYYADPTVIGTFLDNHDLPRVNSLTDDTTLVWNALVGQFLYGGIPIVYQGTEQDIADGPGDPQNREALWNYNDYSTSGETYGRIKNLNKIRSGLGGADSSFYETVGEVLAQQDSDIAIKRGNALAVLTKRGGSGTGTWTVSGADFGNSASIVDLLSCDWSTTSDSGDITITWTAGQPFVYVASDVASQAGLCQ